MAAPAGKMVGACEDSSSSDDEELRRCREAVWETPGDPRKGGNSREKQSKRVVVAVHEHDGNELQVSEGFRTHVAKKLGNLLDSCITEMKTEASSCVESAECDDDDDEGFRLFSTSVPGRTADDPAAPARRRPAPSSSDSDSEVESRLKEAAVSVTDLLPSFTPSSSHSPPCSELKKKKKHAEEEESHDVKKKKKKKRKQNKDESDSAGSPLKAQSNGDHRSSEQEHEAVKAKRKKKKRREGNTEEALN